LEFFVKSEKVRLVRWILIAFGRVHQQKRILQVKIIHLRTTSKKTQTELGCLAHTIAQGQKPAKTTMLDLRPGSFLMRTCNAKSLLESTMADARLGKDRF
jgi:hypothetical protein